MPTPMPPTPPLVLASAVVLAATVPLSRRHQQRRAARMHAMLLAMGLLAIAFVVRTVRRDREVAPTATEGPESVHA